MPRALSFFTAVLVLAAASPAGAAERRLSGTEAYSISAYRGWLLWYEDGRDRPVSVLWRGSRRSFMPANAGISGVLEARLGSDGRGRTAVVYSRCLRATEESHRYRACKLVRHTLVTGVERTLLSAPDSYDLVAPDLAQGSIALVQKPRGEPSALFFHRRGSRPRRLSGDSPFALDADRDRVAYVTGRGGSVYGGAFYVARVIDLRRSQAGYRLLATHDGRYEDGRLDGTTVTSFDSVAVERRYAYWLRSNGRDSGSTFEVWRADLNDETARVQKLHLQHPANAIAVSGGRIYYASSERYVQAAAPGVYEVLDPAWQSTGLRTPVND